MNRTVTVSVLMPISDLVAAAQPEIDRMVEQRLIGSGHRPSIRIRDRAQALQVSIDGVISAITRLENSQGTRDEVAAQLNLNSAARGLRRADAVYKQGS